MSVGSRGPGFTNFLPDPGWGTKKSLAVFSPNLPNINEKLSNWDSNFLPAWHHLYPHCDGCLTLIHNFIDGGFLVTRPRHYVLVICRDVYRQHWGCFIRLENGSAVRISPGIQKIVFSCGDKPLATVCKLERQDAAFMEVELVFIRLCGVEHLHVAVLHADG